MEERTYFICIRTSNKRLYLHRNLSFSKYTCDTHTHARHSEYSEQACREHIMYESELRDLTRTHTCVPLLAYNFIFLYNAHINV